MGKSKNDYKTKDRNLTENRKKGRLNKSVALALAGVAAIGTGSMLTQTKDAQAIMGAVSKVTSRVTSGVKGLATSRVLGGAPSAINSGRNTGNGSPYTGIPKNTSTSTTTTTTTSPLVTQKNNLSTTTVSTSSTSTTNSSSPLTRVKTMASSLNGASASAIKINNGEQLQKTYSQKNNNGGPTLTTQGFYRK